MAADPTVASLGPHAEAAQRLSDYLQQRQIAGQLASASALEGISAAAVTVPTLKVDWPALLRDASWTAILPSIVFFRSAGKLS